MINNCVRQKKKGIILFRYYKLYKNYILKLGKFRGNFWKIHWFNEWNVTGKFSGTGLERREFNNWVTLELERRWSFRKVIRLCRDFKSEWQARACDLKIMALSYTSVWEMPRSITLSLGEEERRRRRRGGGEELVRLLSFPSRRGFAYLPRLSSSDILRER